MSYNSKYTGQEVEELLDSINKKADKSDIPTKVSQLGNDVPYALKSDVEIEVKVESGVYAVTADGELIDYNTADSSCLGVALVQGEHKFMIAKSDATDGSNSTLYWTKSYSDLSLTNYNKADGTNSYGYLPKPDGTFGGSTHLSGDFTTWKAGALSDFNGNANTAIIAAASSDARDMCTVLNTFNASDSHNDWYVPACGQLALMYLNMTEINAALAKIGGTALAAADYWSSSESSSNFAWRVYFRNGHVNNYGKGDYCYRVRFVRDISTEKKTPLKDYTLGLNDKIEVKQDKIPVQSYGTSSTTLSIAPNVLHKWGTVSTLTITLTAPTDTSVYNEYMIQFTSGSTPTTLSVPSTVKWVSEPKIEANKTYQISIVDNIGLIVGV